MRQEGEILTKIRFSIGAKLITIITFIVLISLGSIIALVSWLVRTDLQIMAEEGNFETNRRSAMAAEAVFENTLSNSLILLHTLTSGNTQGSFIRGASEFFFKKNPQIAGLIFSNGNRTEFLLNQSFFDSMNISISLAESFASANEQALRRSAEGETFIINPAAHFSAPVLAMFFPWQSGGGCVLFSPVYLGDYFGHGVNQSYMINNFGDILVHSDFNLVRTSANVGDSEFVRYVWNRSERNAQTLYTDENGKRYFGAFTKLADVGVAVITIVEYDKVFEGINATTRRNMYLTITVLSISIILIWFFSKSISIPLKSLAVAAHKIESGLFEIKLKPKGRDEIGVLTASFQRMSKALGIFGRFTNRDIALRAMRGELKPGGFPKNATIFFSDIREFTSISENLTNIFGNEGSDRIVHWLNGYLTQMVDCVEKTNGVVDKFIGDALMAHWGTAYTTGSTRKDAYNGIASAIMMRRALIRMNKLRNQDDPGSPRIRIGMGINTGIVTAGQIGSDLRMEYTVIGDPVNLASRVESLNKKFGTDILITENTWRLVRRKFVTIEMPSVKVKGKEKPVRIFAVINFAKNPRGPKSLTKLRKILCIAPPANLVLISVSGTKKYKFAKKKR